MRQRAAAAEKDVGHIQLKLRKEVYRNFRRICVDKDTNMRAKATELIEEFIRKETEGPGLLEMTREQKEARASKAVRAAVARSHALGHPTAHADEKGIYNLYPDGHKEYVKLYSAPENTIG
jgi:hypothetical protein